MKSTLEKKQQKQFVWSIIGYVFSGLIYAFGFSLIITSIIGDYLGAGNAIRKAEQATPNIFGQNVSWRYYGIFLILVATALLCITIYAISKVKDNKEVSKEVKANRTKLNLDNVKTEPSIIEAEVKEPEQNSNQ